MHPAAKYKRFRPFLNFDLLPTGAGRISIETDDTILDFNNGGSRIGSDYDLDLSWGLNGGVDFRFTSFFSIAATLRWFTTVPDTAPSGTDHTQHFDVGPTALFRI